MPNPYSLFPIPCFSFTLSTGRPLLPYAQTFISVHPHSSHAFRSPPTFGGVYAYAVTPAFRQSVLAPLILSPRRRRIGARHRAHRLRVTPRDGRADPFLRPQ